jgi:hypothetical protein
MTLLRGSQGGHFLFALRRFICRIVRPLGRPVPFHRGKPVLNRASFLRR